ncbi:hypothetical protein [Hydrogenophaga sp.]|uniref:hypothetical protein n=1 Tax=Hydrogenophaga sp. TaxID=1904254 RepID=UPI003F6E9FD5
MVWQELKEALKKRGKSKGVSVAKKRDLGLNLVINPSGSRIFRQITAGESDVGVVKRGVKRSTTSAVVATVKGASLPMVLPESDVGNFVKAFAASNGVRATRTRLDLFAEAVTRLAGDAVKLDEVGQTLVALRERNLVSGTEMNRLMVNHLREKKRVRSVR